MFNRLPESNAQRQRRPGVLVVSTVVHVVLIALAVRATGLTAAPAPKPEALAPIYLAPRTPSPPETRPIAHQAATTDVSPVPAPPKLPAVISADIPATIPEPGVMSNIIDSFEQSEKISTRGPTRSPVIADGAPYTKDVVEQAVVAIPGTATPRYPSMLQSAGVEGDVRAQFVVDTLGRVEQGSFKSLEATHDLFVAAVRDALSRARFKPAEVGGRRVRQLVEQTFTFRITK